MTSRAEYRLLLRQDNADQRLTPIGRKVGLVNDYRWQRFMEKKESIDNTIESLRNITLNPNQETLKLLEENGISDIKNSITAYELLKRHEVNYDILQKLFALPEITPEVKNQVEISIFYEGYIKKQLEQIAHMEKLESKKIPAAIDYNEIGNLRDEAREKLAEIRPISLGQAGRISGVSPADISVLDIYLEQLRRREDNQ